MEGKRSRCLLIYEGRIRRANPNFLWSKVANSLPDTAVVVQFGVVSKTISGPVPPISLFWVTQPCIRYPLETDSTRAGAVGSTVFRSLSTGKNFAMTSTTGVVKEV